MIPPVSCWAKSVKLSDAQTKYLDCKEIRRQGGECLCSLSKGYPHPAGMSTLARRRATLSPSWCTSRGARGEFLPRVNSPFKGYSGDFLSYHNWLYFQNRLPLPFPVCYLVSRNSEYLWNRQAKMMPKLNIQIYSHFSVPRCQWKAGLQVQQAV